MKKDYLLGYTLLLFLLVGCTRAVSEDIFIEGNAFYSGSTIERLEKDVKDNRPSKLVVASDSHFLSSSIVKVEDEDGVNEIIQARDYEQSDHYKGYPKYDIIERKHSQDKVYTVISVKHGDYYYLISLNLLADAKVKLESQDSLDAAALYYHSKVKADDHATEIYFFEILRKVEAEK